MEIGSFAKELCALARQRAAAYPLKVYPGREKFDEKLDELANLALQPSENVKLDERVFALSGTFRFKPVFLCGYYKTGTSMLHALFDFHPQVVVLLPGSKVLFSVKEKAKKLSRDEFFLYLAREYVKALFNPAGHFPMNLYSENFETLNLERYARFVSYLRYFIDKSDSLADLLSALPCAVFATNGQFEKGHRPEMWLEKSVTSERYLREAKKIFPQAKFLYISRNPYDNLASLKRWYINSGRKNLSNVYMYIMGLRKSLKKGLASKTRDDFYFVRYEDIIEDPQNQMQKIAEFLDISYCEKLTIPTIMGIQDRPNTSDTKEKNKDQTGKILQTRVAKYKADLTEKEIKGITALMAGLMKKLNYEREAAPFFYKLLRPYFKIKALFFRALLKLRG